MSVNSALKGFFIHRLAVRACIAIVMPAIFLIATSFTGRSDRDMRAKQVNILIRLIGHRLLLQAGDSTSRVLPVTETKEGTFKLRFENEFAFKHDSLMKLAQALLPETQFPSGYTVTVHECMTGSIVYGFQMNNFSPDILACRGRKEPKGCYTIEIAFPDLYMDVEEKDAVKQTVVQKKAKRRKAEQEKTGIAELSEELNNGTQLAEELQAVEVPAQKANQIPIAVGIEKSEATTFDYPPTYLVYSGILVLLGVSLLIGRFGRNLRPVLVRNMKHAIVNEPAPESAVLGKFLFDVKGRRLLPVPVATGTGMGSEVINLTDKECRILELLNENFGMLIPRETLMQKVWINEGVITGRSLDMFVSKLRKKLSRDPELRITNVHGKGYKLEITEEAIL